MNRGDRRSTHLRVSDQTKEVDAGVSSFCEGYPLNLFLSLHLEKAGLTRSKLHSFVTTFLHRSGTWLHRTTGQPVRHLSVCENPSSEKPGGGLNVHILIHVPFRLQKRFRALAQDWVEQAGGRYTSGVLKFRRVFFSDTPLVEDYLRHGLQGVLVYMMKGLDPAAPNSLGVERRPQGLIFGKRCGVSQSLQPSKRTWSPEKLERLRLARKVFGYDVLADAPLDNAVGSAGATASTPPHRRTRRERSGKPVQPEK